MRRSLSLKREALTELTSTELGSVNGAAYELTHLGCNPTNGCGHGPSFDEACPTLPLYDCIKIDIYRPATLTCR